MEVVVLDKLGKETAKKIQLDDAIFGIEPSEHTVYLEIKQHLANKRQGTHKSKERSEVAGSTRKIKRQKGTGGARAGDIKNPLFKGGGRVFGPRPRNYGFKLNKAQKRVAKKSVLSQKVLDNALKVVEDINFDAPKTKNFNELLNNLSLSNKKSLFVLGEPNKFVYLSSRNLQNVKVVNFSELTSYDIVNASELVLFESSVEKIQENLRK
ncbi:50S ribosomal protein L4 [Ornithobacterium rhinotracheale]|uniref:Large ribosomal subunit protein uL4 n=1 Tax=Ornithobacterium rhinotracheale (strain ATCC 51463 / DSM 15997 / CCUG 23171 / CIP 104009 / LMG 9086) TaxID=867902 RepID=I3ZY96_ORNRL|nr:50S ribosomal protein L4 [Ornithobacterium rhinotracheale]AFL96680.1 LSU ribosomal protein L4P [Ornithobacterium rhinotracheale DSM 15997]AIQ00582.1 50S ribosomal protein L4 [Ornithobacterium rhinotracheale ORT-UMN 88]KGB66751.1 50S ribosomal protein L4 [Ornithobacterium rhinotracheale H06-030791]MBN3662537.1 50S ribosomal protein L4 [Ornithobacterium rhinotracheale]MCK0194029.1 50S ribosomal protein L4 [Ornithobacterium rhinotracheale]